jgi:raffinose/stachyose/melibiose transport system permease protein
MTDQRSAVVGRQIGNLVLLVAACLAIGPVALLVMNAFKPHIEIVANPIAPPEHLDTHNFVAAWTEGHFATGLLNSLLLCGSTVLIMVITAAMAAYPLARSTAKIWGAVALYFLCSITVPIQLFLFPLYFAFAKLHLLGNVFATAVILAAINLPLSIFLLRTYILSIPPELDDAAVLDGASPFQVFWHVIFPLMKPGLATVAAIVCLAVWNEYLITSTFQQGEKNFTMTLGYLAMNGSISDDQGLLMAGGLIVILPILLVFLATRRFVIDGMTTGAVKG